MVVFGFVDIGGIVDHHCLNFLFIMFFVTFVSYTNVPTVYIFLSNVVCMNPTHGEVYLMQYSAISWQSVSLVEETRVPKENHRSDTSH
jgi:hypothetical protein